MPPDFFDVIFIDVWHRSIYLLWRQVLEYFDAHLVGLTATPAAHTFGFFKQTLIMEYRHEEAVADGVVLDPSAGGVTSVRFFVGTRPSPLPAPRIVCLAPFGTHYGSAPNIALDVVVVGHAGKASAPSAGPALDVAIEGASVSRRARAAGRGPFALGDFESGDHEITVTSAPGTEAALPGRCLFSYNRERERSP